MKGDGAVILGILIMLALLLLQDYILPLLVSLPADPEELLRLALAQQLARLAELAQRYLDMAQIHRTTV